ncbi:MAG: MlaD family protein [Desulfobacterales bacterium]|nr:MlaD family protein [Desulfobacterales bacterium]
MEETKKAVIGGFVIGALALCITAILTFGSGNFFKNTNRYVLYFTGSIRGLNIGAPVLFRGVQIGSVQEISIHLYAHDTSIRIPIIIEIDNGKWRLVGDDKDFGNMGVDTLIEKGLRARLQLQSVITGSSLIEVDFFPGSPVQLTGTDLPLDEIPTIQSTIDRISETLEDLPLRDIVNHLGSVIAGIDDMVNSKATKEITPIVLNTLQEAHQFIKNLDQQVKPLSSDYGDLARNADHNLTTLVKEIRDAVAAYENLARNIDNQVDPLITDYRGVAQSVDSQIAPLITDIRKAADAIGKAAETAETTLESGGKVISNDSPVFIELTKTLKELSAAARSIRVWADYLERHPEALIQGKGSYRR